MLVLSGTAQASVCLRVEMPAQEEAGGGGEPGEHAPYANVGVPVGGQVSAAQRCAAGRETNGK